MPKERTDPIIDEDGDERHPAFGMIGVHRISSNPGETLFQSDLKHREYMTIEIHEASRNRDLKHDWVHPERMVCEVSMSMAGFASFIVSGGTTGVPCTIAFTGSGKHEPGTRPGLNHAPRLSKTHDEVHDAANKAYGIIQKYFDEYQKTLSLTGKGSAAAKKEALRNLQFAIGNATLNVDYATQMLDEHAEAVVEKSRADIEAMVIRQAEQLGISPDSIPAIEQG